MKPSITLPQLATLSLQAPVRVIRNCALERAERHYLMCAETELQHEREARANVAYYQRRAALARSARVQS